MYIYVNLYVMHACKQLCHVHIYVTSIYVCIIDIICQMIRIHFKNDTMNKKIKTARGLLRECRTIPHAVSCDTHTTVLGTPYNVQCTVCRTMYTVRTVQCTVIVIGSLMITVTPYIIV